MKAFRLDGRSVAAGDIEGRVLVHDLGPDLRKGTVLGEKHLARLRESGEIHVVVQPLQEGVVRIYSCGPIVYRYVHVGNLRTFMLPDLLRRSLEYLGYISVFTLMDGQAVAAGEEVAGCKVTPVAVPGGLIERAEQLCRESGPVIELLSFRPLKTFVVATERLKPKARELFRNAVVAKLGWYGAEVLAVREVARTGEAVAAAYREAVASGAELVLFAGASAIDPLDPAYAELVEAGGRVLQLGAPMHPGSMLWLGSLHEAAVVGVAATARSTCCCLSCSHTAARMRATCSGSVTAD
ncbi:MAG: hypothetical protein E6H95_00155 [Chloroflexi bacterium]|nr:MAG: hypothetical protein E6H95_00155 [Chloroflexota bacterium]